MLSNKEVSIVQEAYSQLLMYQVLQPATDVSVFTASYWCISFWPGFLKKKN
jgi:hypothetical protein